MQQLGWHISALLSLLLFAVVAGCGGAGQNPRAEWRPTSGGKEDPDAAGRGGLSSSAVELGVVLREEVGRALGGEVGSSVAWVGLEEVGFLGNPDAQPIIVRFRQQNSQTVLVSYYLVPWQAMTRIEPRADEIVAYPELLTVAEPAIVFGPFDTFEKGEEADELRSKIAAIVSEVVREEENQRTVSDSLVTPPPEGLRIISAEERKFYISLVVALPGSEIPSDSVLQEAAPGRMIRMFLTPDTGQVRERWLVGAKEQRVTVEPQQSPEALFSDYQPKLTPDTACDFRWSICKKFEALPPARLESLPDLIEALADYKERAAANPGRFEPGNMVLGASPKEYQPSDEEMVESEIGRRIELALEVSTRKEAQRTLRQAGIELTKVEFQTIRYTHQDVMGSGRFFYASEPQMTQVELRGRGGEGAGVKQR